jgi:DNA-binding response OmpR family regulator
MGDCANSHKRQPSQARRTTREMGGYVRYQLRNRLPELKIIDVFICKLRKKLASASDGKDYIETVWGRGYVLREPSQDEARISA